MARPSRRRLARRRPSLLHRVIRTAALLLALGLLGLAGCIWFIRGPVVVFAPQRTTGEPSALRLRSDVEQLCRAFGSRSSRDPEQLREAALWIASEWRDAGFDVGLQRYEIDGAEHANVLARRCGRDDRAGGLIVLGAHYDAYWTTPGADDNASGVAALLELARLVEPLSLRHELLLVAFDTEEPPFFGTPDMGSSKLVEQLLRDGETIEFMAALDMVGRFSDEPGSQTWPFAAPLLAGPSRGNFLAVAGDSDMGDELERAKRGLLSARSIPVISLRAPTWFGWTTLSDHSNFRQRGLPGVLLTDTGPLRNFDYHGRGDVPEALDYERLAGVVRALDALLQELDGR